MAIYLVTGGGGFIGSHLVDELVRRGEQVRVIDNFSTGKLNNLAHNLDKIDLYEVDIRDLNALREPLRGVDYVLHQAAIPSVPRSVADPLATHETCATGTLNMLIAARDAGVKRFVYAASSSAYGDIAGEFKVETMQPQPMSPYAVAKLIGEQYCSVFHRIYGLSTVALRYFNVFGPRQDPNSPYSAVIPLFATRMLRGESPVIYGDGTQSRDFTYIDNVLHGNLLACHADAAKVSGQVMNLACGDRTSLLQLVDGINALLGTDCQPIFEPARSGDIKHSRADISKAGELLGYEQRISFEDGLAKTVAWFKDQDSSTSPR
ncbi:MAG: SDR family oxidoreductase [Anaerolineae bacterium]|nr:SDR family oxidoreductase [Anaerolineae bacterium]